MKVDFKKVNFYPDNGMMHQYVTKYASGRPREVKKHNYLSSQPKADLLIQFINQKDTGRS
jgi:hypothetical protein